MSGTGAALLAALHAELAALDSGEAGAIEAATAGKQAALDAARAEPPSLELLREAQALNTIAAARVNMLRAGVARQLANLAEAAGRPAGLCYRADGRTG